MWARPCEYEDVARQQQQEAGGWWFVGGCRRSGWSRVTNTGICLVTMEQSLELRGVGHSNQSRVKW